MKKICKKKHVRKKNYTIKNRKKTKSIVIFCCPPKGNNNRVIQPVLSQT